MPNTARHSRPPSALSFKIGRWAQASATGWGVAALVVLAILLAAVILLAGPAVLRH
jgi:hypothetical protein